MSVIANLNRENNQLVITINGPLTFNEHRGFRDAYKDIEPSRNLSVTVNLQNNDYLDSSALGMLLLLDEHFLDQRINIINCSDYTKQVLEISNFKQKFNIS